MNGGKGGKEVGKEDETYRDMCSAHGSFRGKKERESPLCLIWSFNKLATVSSAQESEICKGRRGGGGRVKSL